LDRKILVIDDDPGVTLFVKEKLEANDYKVVIAKEGEEGIRKAAVEMPHLILLDIVMPKVSGGEVVRKLKKNKKTENIPIIFISTAYDSNDSRIEDEHPKLNVDDTYYDVIPKPISTETLLQSIERIL